VSDDLTTNLFLANPNKSQTLKLNSTFYVRRPPKPKPRNRGHPEGEVTRVATRLMTFQFRSCFSLFFRPFSGPAPPDGYAVIAYLHSGDFSNGSPFEINPFQLVFKQKVIVVTIAYRLSILGFFTTLDGEAIGNFGLMDQSAALFWIKKNVKAFGGNEDNVTLMGHGSGATSVCLHLTAKDWSFGTFHKAIIMSGTSFGSTTIRPASHFSRAIDRTAYAFGCNRRPTSMLMECMRRVDPKVLVETVPDQHWGPIIDYGMSNTTAGFIAEDPEMLIEHGHLMSIPILVGFTNMEEAYDLMAANMVEEGVSLELYESMINEIVATDFSRFESNDTECTSNNQMALEAVNFLYKPYPPTDDKIMLRNFYLNFLNDRKYLAPTIGLAAHMSKQADTFVYRFDLKPRTMIDIPEDIGVPHGFEQIFIWGLPYWGSANDIAWDNADKRVSDIIMTMWANFAKYTNPTHLGVYIKWDNFTHANPSILIIDRSFNMSDFRSLNHHAIKFWNEYYPSVLTYAASCCNMTESAGIPTASVSRYYTFTICLVLGQLFVFLYHMTVT
jgi:cholinesterase